MSWLRQVRGGTGEREGAVLRAAAAAYAAVVVVLAVLVALDEVDVLGGPGDVWLVVATAPGSLVVLALVGLVAPALPGLVQVVLYLAVGLLQALVVRDAGRPG